MNYQRKDEEELSQESNTVEITAINFLLPGKYFQSDPNSVCS